MRGPERDPAPGARWRRSGEVPRGATPTLIAPAAVRVVDLEAPLGDLWLPPAHFGQSYRSLLTVARIDGDPLGTAALPVHPTGLVSRHQLAHELRCQLEAELREVLAERGRALPPSLPSTGIPGASGPPGNGAPTPHRSVSVVVTTCHDAVALERCLRSILASEYHEFEVIVVENRPGSPATLQMLEERFPSHPRLRYVEEPSPGRSQARNAGLALAEGDLVAFTDDDVVVDPAWLRHCAEAFARAEDVACVTGLILPLELETESQLTLEQFAGFGKGFRRRTYRLDTARVGDPPLFTSGVIGSGANTILRTHVARQLGGFDTSLGSGTPAAGGEDLDLYIRLLRGGYAVTYEPSAIVWHAHPDGRARLRRQVYRYGVGLGAMLAKQLVAGPKRRELLRAVPAGVQYARNPASRKNAGKTADYPRRLDWRKRLGMLIGPLAYLISILTATIRRWSLARHGGAAVGNAYVERLALSSGETVEVVRFPEAAAPPAATVRAGGTRHLKAGGRGEREPPRPGHRALTAIAAAACVEAPLFVALGAPTALRFPAVLALLCLAPGTAFLPTVRGRVELGLALGASLATGVVLAQSMLWLGDWWPKGLLYGLAAICLPPLLARLSLAGELGRIRGAVTTITRSVGGHAAVLTAVFIAWGASLMGADLSQIDGFGLVSAIPPTYLLALALLLVGFITAATREQVSPKLLAAYVIALIVVIHGTTPLLYDEPRYQWVYKHIAVIDFIAKGGGVDRHIDIYNNWPGFFALNAWLSGVTGVNAGAYAPWAQVFFNLANVAVLRFALRGVTRDERLLWTAAWIFVLGNWVGQDYLAPQAFGFVLSLVVLGLCLRCAPPPRVPRSWAARRWGAGLERLRSVVVRRAPIDEPLPAGPLSPRGALVVGGACYLAVVVSHQLTPLILIAGVTGLALVARRVPLWVPLAMAAIEVWWLALAWPYISQHWSLFDPNLAASGAPSGYDLAGAMPGQALVVHAARLESVLIAGLAVVGLVRRARAGHWDIAAASLILAPLVVFGGQSYGGEGRYRVYLFALPWLCLFAAAACAPATRSRFRGVLRQWRLALAGAAASVCLLLAYFGLEFENRIDPQDVAAAVWFERHAPRDSVLVQVTGNSISRVTGRYATAYDPTYSDSPILTDEAVYRHRRLDSKDLPRLEATLRGYGPRTFLILNEGQRRFARLYGILRSGWQPSLERALYASPAFHAVYARGPDSIFRFEQ